ncbi:type III secretion protein [Pectobacterium aroidearum]|uniref:Type III secretion protein n=1 Tax=Pectobacterium aroidearum TaxID=1201031 RepID=A0ABR5Z9K1_9GAMM|nr:MULTISPECIES: type III secretion system chaperone [Pectobacterium]MBA5198392.1 type III secretion protein [Pectobacterium aroidearum]MBA5227104.1 type III secretion protein [Pectobacterium aroidearum]MBA5231185.1 type III secretion protein [Pectobacterium aroidearum]MBA5736331.1 type III secretion protein [Pectobacterium aroidearum]QPI41194.1 type III secretion protein [Pectobacterium aroidearum]
MTSTELAAMLERWLNGGTSTLKLEIDGGAVAMVRQSSGVTCRAVIPLRTLPDEPMLTRALQLADAAHAQFQDDTAILSLSAQDEQLWLWMRPDADDVMQLCRSLETLLNQRDVWLSMLTPRAKVPVSAPLNLNTLAFLQGERHA